MPSLRHCVLPPLLLIAAACATTEPAAPPDTARRQDSFPSTPGEVRLSNLRQLTFGGENAEAYWSFDGKRLVFQATRDGAQCDRIYQLDPFAAQPQPEQLSTGEGVTTCAYYLPGDKEVVYASTHAGGKDCPPRPDRSEGYVWALYDTYDLYKMDLATRALTRLTDAPGYDAEATVCGKDGSIIFTSVRDGDLELYRMDRDGRNVKRLTHTPGYDGGAFFSADCSQIVWRASRPAEGKELDDFRALLARDLVRPSQLELWVANADGSEARQITHLGAASFAPFFHPSGRKILFSTNFGDPKGREFDLWSINVDGTGLERITHAPGFDGFPMFSPDGKYLAFGSNRANAPGAHDTNVFLAEWNDDAQGELQRTSADEVIEDVRWLADPAREGRGLGTAGLNAAGGWIEARFKELGLAPGASDGTYRQSFPVVTSIDVGDATSLKHAGKTFGKQDVVPLGFSAQGTVTAPVVFAGYGIAEKALGHDDYARLDVKGKLVLVRRFVPEDGAFSSNDAQRRYGDLRYKAWAARERGAKGLIVTDLPQTPKDAPAQWRMPDEAAIPVTAPEGPGDAGIPVVIVKRALGAELAASKKAPTVELTVALTPKTSTAFNVIGKLETGADGAVVVGAHYDHLGMGGRDSLAPEKHEPHVGADDNASGVAGVLEVARQLTRDEASLKRDVYFVAFAGEETGLLGSTQLTREPPKGLEPKAIVSMLNLDMIGRLRNNTVQILGGDSASEWAELVAKACAQQKLRCTVGGDGYGPSDQTPFYATGIPVLHFFTGAHSDYHKPSDSADKVNAGGIARIASVVALLVKESSTVPKLTYRAVPSPAPRGDLRSFNASLGTVPDYAGPPGGEKGMLLAGVRPGGAADQAGLKRGDILVRLGKHQIGGVEDLMYALNASKPGETVTAVVRREGKEVSVEVTFQESKRR